MCRGRFSAACHGGIVSNWPERLWWWFFGSLPLAGSLFSGSSCGPGLTDPVCTLLNTQCSESARRHASQSLAGLLQRSHTKNITRWSKNKSLNLGASTCHVQRCSTLCRHDQYREWFQHYNRHVSFKSTENLSATCHSSVFSQWTQSCNGHGSGSAHAMAGKDGTCYNINTTRSSKLSIQQTVPPPQPSPEEANIISHHPTRYRMCDGGQTPASSINTKYMEHTEHGKTS